MQKVQPAKNSLDMDFLNSMNKPIGGTPVQQVTPVSAPVAQKLAAAIKKIHGIDAKFIGIGGGTVGAELRREGIDAVVWSTLDDQAHQPNEYCIIDNIIRDAETLVEVFKN